jgi:TonB family protein
MSGLFGEGSSSRGETEGEGTQGVSTGSATAGATSGIGGIGSYDLGGRSLGRGGLVQPSYTVNDYGTVVVNITVDPAGNVIHAEIGRGTNTPSTSLRSEALRAARGTKFNAINSANNQQGTITYRFNLK